MQRLWHARGGWVARSGLLAVAGAGLASALWGVLPVVEGAAAWRAALLPGGFSVLFVCLAWIDARSSWLPDELTGSGLAIALLSAGLWEGLGPLDHLIGALVAGLPVWAAYVLLPGRIGDGDAKMATLVGAAAGWQALGPALFPAAAAVLLWVGPRAVRLRWQGRSLAGEYVSGGPFLAIWGVVAVWTA